MGHYSNNLIESTTRKQLHTRPYVLFTTHHPLLHTQLRAFWKLNEKWLIWRFQSDQAITENWGQRGSLECRCPHISPHFSSCPLGWMKNFNFCIANVWQFFRIPNSWRTLLEYEPHMHLNVKKGPFLTKRPLGSQAGLFSVLLCCSRENMSIITLKYCTKQVSPSTAVACVKHLYPVKTKQVYVETTEQTEGTWGNLRHKPVDSLKYLSDESAWFQMSCIY